MPFSNHRVAAHLEPEQRELDVALRQLHLTGRLLPAMTPTNGPQERARLVQALERGEAAEPRFETLASRVSRDAWSALTQARRLINHSVARDLYEAKLDELELDLLMLEALGQPKRIRPLAARRFGTGRESAPGDEEGTVADVAAHLLDTVEQTREPLTLPADAPDDQPSLARAVRRLAEEVGLEIEVRVEPRLAAGAAAGERLVLVADRCFGVREAQRLAVHEVLGHAVAAANGRAQPLRLFEIGTAGSFSDQEGVALWLEEQAGLMDGRRLRTIAARVWVVDRMHSGATFPDTARALVRELEFSAFESIVLCERCWRGGGVARDAGYLRGLLRVRAAIDSGHTDIDELRTGRIGVGDVSWLSGLAEAGLYRTPVARPSLASSLRATAGGTSRATSPPSSAASLTMFEET